MQSPLLNRIAVLVLVLWAPVASAHHSFASYDMAKEVTVKGEVKVFVFQNPHSGIRIAVTDEQGRTVDWLAETGAPTALAKLGWRRSILKTGDKVTLVVHPLKDGGNGGSLVRAILADGTVLETGRAEQ